MKQKQLMMREQLDSFLLQHINKAISDFDAMFGAGTSGENVPTNLIEHAHVDIAQQCSIYNMEINFTNELNSFEHCKDIRWNLMLEDFLKKKSSKSSILKKYDQQAAGSYAAIIRKELVEVLDKKGMKPDAIKRMVKQ